MQHAAEEPGAPAAQAPLSIDVFAARVGESFPVGGNTLSHELNLVRVDPLPHSPRAGGGFRLEFLGSPEQFLPQAIYAFRINGASHEIFIVPLGPDPQGQMRYEAVFF